MNLYCTVNVLVGLYLEWAHNRGWGGEGGGMQCPNGYWHFKLISKSINRMKFCMAKSFIGQLFFQRANDVMFC